MTPPDDLKLGMHIVVVEDLGGPLTDMFGREQPTTFDGVPARIISICLPFIAVETRGQLATLDLRAWGVQKVNRHYAKVMSGFKPAPKKRARKAKPEPGRCIRCGERLRQRQSKATDYRWHNVCPNCGFDAGPVEAKK